MVAAKPTVRLHTTYAARMAPWSIAQGPKRGSGHATIVDKFKLAPLQALTHKDCPPR
jgi:hypothetical protein